MAKQIVKRRLMIIQGSIRSRLARTLFSYRLTPQTMTGISPRELLLGRHPRSRLDLLKSHMVERVERNQLKQKEQHYSTLPYGKNLHYDRHRREKSSTTKLKLLHTGSAPYPYRIKWTMRKLCYQLKVSKLSLISGLISLNELFDVKHILQ